MNLGNLSEWINAGFAGAALFLAWQAGKQAKQLYQDDKRRELQNEELRKREDAAKFSIWIAAEKDKTYLWGMVLNNVSVRPLYNLEILVQYSDTKNGEEIKHIYKETNLLPPGRFFIPFNNQETNPFVFGYPTIYDENRLQPLLVTKKHKILSVTFTDSDGINWKTDATGNLEKQA